MVNRLFKHEAPARQARQRARGFTLIELVVVVAVIGILTTIAVPSFTRIIATSRAKTTATDFYLALIKARSSAVKFNTNVSVLPNDPAWKTGWSIGYASSSGGWEVIARQSELSPTVSIAQAPVSVVYTSSGRVKSAAKFQITAQSGRAVEYRCVTVDTGGHPYVAPKPC